MSYLKDITDWIEYWMWFVAVGVMVVALIVRELRREPNNPENTWLYWHF